MLPNCVLIRTLLNSLAVTTFSNNISDSGNSDRDDSKSDGLGEDSSDKIENLRNIRLSRYYYDLEDMNEHGRLGIVLR